MKSKNLILVLVMVLLSAGLLLYGLSARRAAPQPTVPTEEPGDTEDVGEAGADGLSYSEDVLAAAAAYLEQYPAESYLLVTTANNVYSPIPLNEDGSFRITQADGSENVIHIGKNSFYMESSNCDNQNCVGEGEVTLENMSARVLYNMVLCLPHQLMLEMLTPAEAEAALREQYALQQAYQAALQSQAGDETP